MRGSVTLRLMPLLAAQQDRSMLSTAQAPCRFPLTPYDAVGQDLRWRQRGLAPHPLPGWALLQGDAPCGRSASVLLVLLGRLLPPLQLLLGGVGACVPPASVHWWQTTCNALLFASGHPSEQFGPAGAATAPEGECSCPPVAPLTHQWRGGAHPPSPRQQVRAAAACAHTCAPEGEAFPTRHAVGAVFHACVRARGRARGRTTQQQQQQQEFSMAPCALHTLLAPGMHVLEPHQKACMHACE